MAAHVSPIGDVIDHDISSDDPDCVCGPDVVPAVGEDGPVVGFLIVHHSLDGREHLEA